MIQLEQITLLPQEDEGMLRTRACKKLGIGEKDLLEFQILRQVLDARQKGNIFFRCLLKFKWSCTTRTSIFIIYLSFTEMRITL